MGGDTGVLRAIFTAAYMYVQLLCIVKSEKIEVEEIAGGNTGKIRLSGTRFRRGIILHLEQT